MMMIHHHDMNRKTLIVGGFFDDDGGKPSRDLVPLLHETIDPDATLINGGYFSDLEELVKNIKQYDVIYWFANVPNDKEKIVGDIKKTHEACVLITSKRNDKDKYDLSDIIYHALGIKSNLVVEFKKKPGMTMEAKGSDFKEKDVVEARVLDPLANVFLDFTSDFTRVGKALAKRVDEISHFTRVGSTKVGENIDAPDDDRFFGFVKEYATVFHELIHHHPNATNRFFGNATFRCERGFPSVKDGDVIFVSRRNMDKRYVDKASFVAVNAASEKPVQYHGDEKPSVDAPIQIKLYQYYKNIRYMIHALVYIDDAETTDHVIPCGAIEEAYDIIDKFPDKNAKKIYLNLRGHGSIAMVKNVKDLENIPYVPMPVPLVNEGFLYEHGSPNEPVEKSKWSDVFDSLLVFLVIAGIIAIPGFIIAAFVVHAIGSVFIASLLAIAALGVVIAFTKAQDISVLAIIYAVVIAVAIVLTIIFAGSEIVFWFNTITAIVESIMIVVIAVFGSLGSMP